MNGFREIAEEDAVAVAALWRACGLAGAGNDPHKDISLARRAAGTMLLVREGEGGIAATVMAEHGEGCGTLHYVAVAPHLQRRGIGSEAVRAAEAWLARRGVSTVNLLLRAGDAAVRGFYESLGYEVNPALCMARKTLPGPDTGR